MRRQTSSQNGGNASDLRELDKLGVVLGALVEVLFRHQCQLHPPARADQHEHVHAESAPLRSDASQQRYLRADFVELVNHVDDVRRAGLFVLFAPGLPCNRHKEDDAMR